MRKLITILLVLFAAQGFGQIYQSNKTFGWEYKRLKIDSTLHAPTFNGLPTLRGSVIGDQGAVAIDSTNNKFYFYNPKDSSWNNVAASTGTVIVSGDGVDSVTYSSNELCQWIDGVSTCYRLNKFFDSTSYEGGKIYHWNNGIVRDSVNISDTNYYKSPIYKDGDTTKLRVDSMPIMRIIADTTGMPGNGVPTLDMVNARMGGGSTDTSHLSDRINEKLNIIDTASMLSPYLRKNAIAEGTNISFTGTGTSADPIVINASGGGAGGVSELGDPGFGLEKANDSTYNLDTANISTVYVRLKDSLSVYTTPKQISDSIAANKVMVITKSPLATFLKHDSDPYDSIGIRQASATDSGYLSKEDWNRFNNVTDTSFRVIQADNLKLFSGMAVNPKKGLYMLNNTPASASITGQSSPPIYYKGSSYTGGTLYNKWIRQYMNGTASTYPSYYIDASTDSTNWTNIFNVSTNGISIPGAMTAGGFSTSSQLTIGSKLLFSQTYGFLIGAAASSNPMTLFEVRDTTKGLLINRGSTIARLKLGTNTYAATITNGGSGYTGTQFSNIAITGGSGTGGLITGTITAGVVTAITSFKSGSGAYTGMNYRVGDVISATIPGGTGFSATITQLQGDNAPGLMFYDTTINKLFTWNTTIHNWEGYGTNPHAIFTPTTGGTVTTVAQQEHIINPAGTIAVLTVALPSAPYNNDHVWLKFTQAVTAITYSGGTVVGIKTAATQGDQWYLTYDSSTSTWY